MAEVIDISGMVLRERDITVKLSQVLESTRYVTSPSVLKLIAGETVSGGSAVYARPNGRAYRASNDTKSQIGHVLGICAGAAAEGEEISVGLSGHVLQDIAWAFDPEKPVYVGFWGGLTQTPPTANGYVQIIAKALTATSIVIQLQPPIEV